MSTHIMQEVEAICDRVIIINKGKIVADKPIADIKKSIIATPILMVEFKNNVELEKLKNISGVTEVIKQGESKYQIKHNNKTDIREQVFKFAVANQLDILSLQEKESTLEDVFKSLTA